jgi:phage regulator Rha-like protein
MTIKNDFLENIKEAINFVNSKNKRLVFNINNLNLSNLKGKGVIYFIFITSKDGITSLKYIGKSRGHLFKQRLVNHFDHSHKLTATKREEINREIDNGNIVEYSFLTTQPESLRNSIEEELIIYFKEKTLLWNGRKKKKTTAHNTV